MGRHRGNHADDGDADPRGAEGRSRRRRRRGGAVAALTSAVAIILAVGLTGTYIFLNQSGCSGQDVTLDVAVSPELTTAVQGVAKEFNDQDYAVDGQCVRVSARGVASADVAYGITGGGPTMGDTESQVWIPDSSLWVNFVKENSGDGVVNDTGTSVASSPLVLAQPEKVAEEDGDEASWKTLVPTAAPGADGDDTDVRLVDPVRSSSGLATLALVSDAVGGGDEEGRAQLVAAIQALQEGATPSEEAAFEAFAEQSAGDGASPVLVLSEQAAARYNQDHADAPARVRYPDSGSYSLDYPYVTRTDDPLATRAAQVFRSALEEDAAQKRFQREGFRTADGKADSEALPEGQGFQADIPENLPTPNNETVERLTQAWNQFKLGTRLLTIVDVSGSMLEEVPGTGMSRMQVTTAAADQGLSLFNDRTELGLWEFSTALDGDRDHRELLPVEELASEGAETATHRQDIAAELAGLQPVPDGNTGLYDTYLAAYREMASSYKSDRVNAILMLTDGNNDDPDGVSLKELASTIEEESNPHHPIPVFTIAFGPGIDLEPMEKVAELTGGEAYKTENPAEIGDIFLQAFSQRLENQQGQEGS
ncbi:substrate-binding and VWA domain-containing protein [Nocardiopsis sp. RSe5-2]|uniref:Substrate-binding and VWA domain-containing protein n=1 Tax=Nocardiopsis endophytica TaxID=3018445 RepID=A0ABT4U3U5_9ACTN|nr:substrate-binding and VWA domain-containing protein [Nocardiopsis endophytica]MDA2811115.1 substrate-binding and VWA domain-containing protein [Nocardiopsis endophytica]